jgi:two-component system, OmpR family, sensor histidine kinase QseC
LNSIDRTSHLVDQLLTLSRLDHLTAPFYTATVNWTDISSEAIESINLYARERHCRIRRQFQTKPAAVLPLSGDHTLLTILIRNLLDNAIRYSPEYSTINLILAASNITITNPGNGVAPENLQRLRERFLRPAGQKARGSGLGLSIVDSIAQLHGLKFGINDIKNKLGQRVGLQVEIHN